MMRSFQIKYVVALINGEERYISFDEMKQYDLLKHYGQGWERKLAIPISTLISDDNRTLNALATDSHLYVGDLTMISEMELYRVPGIGAKGVERTKKLLAGLGLSLLVC